jgi:threonine synthase
MKNNFHYECSKCGKVIDDSGVVYTCPVDGANLDININQKTHQSFKPASILSSRDFSIWRYKDLLPVQDPGYSQTALHSVGWTPIYRLSTISKELGLPDLFFKDDGRNPTASFKDRASAILIARAKEIAADIVVTASTGNAGAALAGMAAATGHKAIIFAPKTAPQAKIAQLLVFGAQVFLVDGNYDQAFDLTIQASQEFGWYCRNTGYNPFTTEGKKTAAFEVWEQIIYQKYEDRKVTVFIPVGDGNIISGIYKGFKDLYDSGWLKFMPRLVGVQAEGSSAIADAFLNNQSEILSVSATTLADSISVDMPRDGYRALRAVKDTSGIYITVSDGEILKSIAILGKEGIFCEPAAATAYAGLRRAVSTQYLTEEDVVVVMLTGSGLKDIKAAINATRQAPIIQPTLSDLKKAMGR